MSRTPSRRAPSAAQSAASSAQNAANAAQSAVSAAQHRSRQMVIYTGCPAGICTARCPAAAPLVMGGGCRMVSTGTIRGMTPGFSSGSFPSTGDSTASLDSGPRWNQYSCEPQTGTVQTVYAICCAR